MKNIFVLLLVLLSDVSFASVSYAAESKVNQLAELIMFERLGESASHQVVQQAIKFHHLALSEEQASDVQRKIKVLIFERFRVKNGLRDITAAAYSRLYTPEEVDELLKFLSSDVGKKFIKLDRAVSDEISKNLGVAIEAVTTDLDSEVKVILQKKGINIEN